MVSHVTQRIYAGLSAEERIQARKKKLLAAALEIVGTQGYKSATLRVVCKEAELTQRYYYEAFENVEDMLIQLYQHQEQFVAEKVLSSVTENLDPSSALEVALRTFFQTMKDNPRTVRVLFFETLGVSEKVDATYRKGSEHLEQLILQFSLPLLPADFKASANAKLMAIGLVGFMGELTRNWMLNQFSYETEEIVATMMFMVSQVLDTKI